MAHLPSDSGSSKMPKRLAIFCSGGGSNAKSIIDFFDQSAEAEIVLLIANKSNAGALDKANAAGIANYYVPVSAFCTEYYMLDLLTKHKVDMIILAGFLLLIPPFLVNAFPSRILNIHPALLPKYGGKGMYGHHVHDAVIAASDTNHGCTIHLVDNHYDTGLTLTQAIVPIVAEDTSATAAAKVLILEHFWYPRTISAYIYSISKD